MILKVPPYWAALGDPEAVGLGLAVAEVAGADEVAGAVVAGLDVAGALVVVVVVAGAEVVACVAGGVVVVPPPQPVITKATTNKITRGVNNLFKLSSLNIEFDFPCVGRL